jgi:hypothetical protein
VAIIDAICQIPAGSVRLLLLWRSMDSIISHYEKEKVSWSKNKNFNIA